MSKKFLSPIKLAQGATNPAVGSEGELFWNTADLKVYVHNGTSWAASGGAFTMSPTAPTSPEPKHGDPWLDTSDGSLYVFYDDGVGTLNTNYVLNPTFSAPGDGLANWAVSSGTGTRVTSESYSGTASMQVVNASFSSARLKTDFMSVIAGQPYTASVWVKKTSSSAPVSLWLEHYDSSDTWLNTIYTTANSTSTTDWQRIVVTKTFEAPTVKVKLRVSVGDAMSGTSTVYVDAVQFEVGSSATTYFDGSLPGCSWTGTAQTSTSVNPSGGSTGQWIQIQTTSAINSELANRATALESDVTTLQAQTAGFEADVIALDARADSLEARATAVESRATVLEARNTSPNYIINGAMDIWQRGTSFAPVANTAFTADRWQAQASLVPTSRTIQQIALSGAIPEIEDIKYYLRSTVNTIGTGTNTRLRHKIEGADTLAGKTVTLSWYAKQNFAGNYRVLIQQNFGTGGSPSVTAYDANTSYTTSWQRLSVTFVMPSIAGKTIASDSFIQIELFQADITGSVLELTGVQFEAGAYATPFRRNAPSIQAELAACQRYYYRLNAESAYGMFGTASTFLTTAGILFIPFPVQMRAATPSTLDSSGVATFEVVPGTLTAVAMQTDGLSSRGAALNITGTGFLQNGATLFRAKNSTSTYLAFSAEL